MPRIEIRGRIAPNEYKEYYDYFGVENTTPGDVAEAIRTAEDGEELDIRINSPGGEIGAGSEIYTMLREAGSTRPVNIKVTGLAASAASIIAMSGHCEMSPTSMMMVHCVSTFAEGNHSDMRKTADMLESADRALCSAYTAKSGMTEAEALEMMENTTWLSPQEALDRGLIDGIMFNQPVQAAMFNSFDDMRPPTPEQLARVHEIMTARQTAEEPEPDLAVVDRTAELTARLNLLRLTAR